MPRTVLLSTPTYALHLAEIASQENIDLCESTIKTTIHAGEPGASIPETRKRIERAWNAQVIDHAGSTEVGAFGVGDLEGKGLYVNEEEFIAEVFEPRSTTPAKPDTAGELIITNLGRGGWPVIRYRTGDLVHPIRISSGPMQGRLFLQGGILGRTDEMITVRGVNIYPSVLENLIRSVIGRGEFKIVASTFSEMDQIEIELEGDQMAGKSLARKIREKIGLRVDVKPAKMGTLPRWKGKAKRFDDRRTL